MFVVVVCGICSLHCRESTTAEQLQQLLETLICKLGPYVGEVRFTCALFGKEIQEKLTENFYNKLEMAQKTLTGSGFEPETSGFVYQRSCHLSYPALRW